MFKSIIQKILGVTSKSKIAINDSLSEDEYYRELFTKDEQWSKPNPNSEENLRWGIIENFIYFVKGAMGYSDNTTMNILDLGCGRGWLTNLMSTHGTIKGIEPVGPVVEYANKIFPHLDISCGSAKDLLDANSNVFNLVVSSEVIEHVPNDQKKYFVQDINQLLSDNGFVIVTTPRQEAQNEWMQYSTPDQPVEDWMTEAMVEKLFVENGFVKRLLERFSVAPSKNKPLIEIYQLWLFQKKVT
jgi:2-polyprenyl-3-methyl-5-hydroxy-6-metoxy-1,4-benzoquinol methylase